jgi:hypothetical protein
MHRSCSRCASGQPTWCLWQARRDRDAASSWQPMLARRAHRARQISPKPRAMPMCEEARTWRSEAHTSGTSGGQTAASLSACRDAHFVSALLTSESISSQYAYRINSLHIVRSYDLCGT